MARMLLDVGANANVADSRGRTALFACATAGQLAMSKLLLDRGADATLVDRHGFNCPFLARERGFTDFLSLPGVPAPQCTSVEQEWEEYRQLREQLAARDALFVKPKTGKKKKGKKKKGKK